jgi:UrcA family protein
MTRLYPRFAALAAAASLAVAVGTLAATATPAYAAEGTGARTASVRVAYDDLNLRSEAGLRRLDARIRTAAERLCGRPGTIPLREQRTAEACRDQAIAAATPQILRATRAQPVSAILLASGR